MVCLRKKGIFLATKNLTLIVYCHFYTKLDFFVAKNFTTTTNMSLLSNYFCYLQNMTLIVLFCYLKPQLFWIALRGMHVATREYGLHKWDIYKSWILVCIVSSHSSRQVYIHMHIRWDLVMYAMFVVLTKINSI